MYSDKARSFNQWQRALDPNFVIIDHSSRQQIGHLPRPKFIPHNLGRFLLFCYRSPKNRLNYRHRLNFSLYSSFLVLHSHSPINCSLSPFLCSLFSVLYSLLSFSFSLFLFPFPVSRSPFPVSRSSFPVFCSLYSALCSLFPFPYPLLPVPFSSFSNSPPCSLFPVPRSLFSVFCSLFPVPCSLFPILCSLFLVPCFLLPFPCSSFSNSLPRSLFSVPPSRSTFSVLYSSFSFPCSPLPIPCSLFPVPCSQFLVSRSLLLFPVQYFLFPVHQSLFPNFLFLKFGVNEAIQTDRQTTPSSLGRRTSLLDSCCFIQLPRSTFASLHARKWSLFHIYSSTLFMNFYLWQFISNTNLPISYYFKFHTCISVNYL